MWGPSASALPRSIFLASKKQWEKGKEDETRKRLTTSVAMTTTTSGPCLFTGHLSSARAKFVFSACSQLLLREDRGVEEEDILEPGTLAFGASVPHFRWPEVEGGNGRDAASPAARRTEDPADPLQRPPLCQPAAWPPTAATPPSPGSLCSASPRPGPCGCCGAASCGVAAPTATGAMTARSTSL